MNSLAGLNWLLGLAITLLLGAWVFSTLPWSGPDESSHFLRALSITNGQLLGRQVAFTAPAPITPTQRRWVSGNTTAVQVPPNLSPPEMRCASNNLPDTAPAGCVEQSYNGNYPPLPYLLPAAALAVSNNATGALWLGRVVSVLPCLALIALAFMFAVRGGLWPLFGLAVALTPMSLFMASVINPTGLQITASLAFAAGLLRLVRNPATLSTTEAVAIAVAGVVTVVAWQLGPLFAICDVALAAAMLDRRRVSEIRARPRLVLGLTVALGVAVLLYLIWALVSGSSHGGLSLGFGSNVTSASHQLNLALHESIGSFALNDVPVPHALYLAWLAIALASGVAAVLASPWRLRLVAIAAPVLALLIPFLLAAFVLYNATGGLQARYTLPLFALPPLVWGELLGRAGREPVGNGAPVGLAGTITGWGKAVASRAWPFAAIGIAATAVLQCWAWWTNARTSANPSRAFWFLSTPTWSPPLGWPVWTAAALAGCLLLIAVAGLGARFEAASSAAS